MRRITEHTADAGIEVEADSLPEAFHEASLAFTEIVTGGNLPQSKRSHDIELESTDLDSILVKFISNLIFLFDSDDFLVSSAKVEIKSDSLFILKGTLFGDTYDQSEHGYGVEIKAVSYHLLEVVWGPPSKIKVILDL
ncbi:MAG: archease [Candidatus Thermoplasmatota archaeon]|nr:archease [Candidatus Thermoplasmatota archaeon]MEC8997285.1 archease [Candidatus Thermoplasmatota archaeon]MEC9333067.1 archease [Candidatus Thermoplasmatota archaeon]MEE3242533.1 archease [Candidatus Thermoplasmatota archaeon]